VKGRLTLELLDLLGGELRGEPAGSVLVVVEHRVLGLLLAAKPNPNKIPVKSQINKLASPGAN